MEKKIWKYTYCLILPFLFMAIGCGSNKTSEKQGVPNNWPEIEQKASNQTVTMMMWQGDPLINTYMKNFVVPTVKDKYGIDLEIVPGQGNQIVSTLISEQEAGAKTSQLDMMWINGETFYQLRKIKALHGPFVDRIPNNKYINWDSPFIRFDFQQEVDGYECPWGNVQLAIIYNSEYVENPPETLQELENWVKSNPGKFTIGNDFTGMTLLKSWLTFFAGGPEKIKGEFNEEVYRQSSEKLWAYINRIKPYFWNGGETFPSSVAQMHQLFANGEIWFTMSNNDSEVDNKINQGLFSENSRAYVPTYGAIQNSHYLGIAAKSDNKAAAMVVINYMISPEAQYQKMKPDVWGDHTILDIDRLPQEWKVKFNEIPGRQYAPQRSEIQENALMEPAPEYMIRLFSDFRTEVMEK